MPIVVRGDFSKLAKWAERLDGVPHVKRSILANVGEELIELIREGFDRQADPYGSPWAPTVRGGRILRDRGHLSSSWHRKTLSSSQVVVGPGVEYARYHQTGTRRMPARKMVPDSGLPAGWERRVVKIAKAALREALKG